MIDKIPNNIYLVEFSKEENKFISMCFYLIYLYSLDK